MKKGKRADEIEEIEKQFCQGRDAGIFMGWGDSTMYSNVGQMLSNQQLHQQFSNFLPNDPAARGISKRKLDIMQEIYDKGFTYNMSFDDEFVPV